ncbi:MAG: L-threonylcarbamoyladenylate synthase [Gammaproteobacteria bacterium]
MLARARRVVDGGGVIAYPTEGVFGLGCNPFDVPALARVGAIKRRGARKSYILLAASVAQIETLVEFRDPSERTRVLATWPGPVTWILRAGRRLPIHLRGPGGTIAVRVTSHRLAALLCARCGPLVSTSANLAGHRPARETAEVRWRFSGAIDLTVAGIVGDLRGPTEIRDARNGRIVRRGASLR